MASLTRARARKPLIPDGVAYGAVRPIWVEDPANPGFNKSHEDGYTLTINDGKDSRVSYELTLSRREMLDAVCSWFAYEQQLARRAEKSGKKGRVGD